MRTLPKRFTAPDDDPVTTASTAPPLHQPTPSPVTVPTAPSWPGHELLDSPLLARVLLAAWGGDPATVVPACPGAGKSRLVALAGHALADGVGLRVAVAAQTREQAAELARRITALSDRAALIVSTQAKKRNAVAGVRTIAGRSVRWTHASGGEILIATTARWLYADPAVLSADVLLVDEAWQCTYADLGALGALARQVVCVGDPGQVAPVVTGSTARWADNPTGPHVPAPTALLAAHGEAVTVYELTNSWRLGPQTCALLSQHFYPQMPFTSRRPDEAVVAPHGTVLPEIQCHRVEADHGPTDPKLLAAIANRVRELTWHGYRRDGETVSLTGADIAVVVPHVAQAGAVRALLAGVPGVLVGTVNALQGLERPAVVALHPMAGYRTPEPFALDAGRMCVTLSRHRAHVSVLVDQATEAVLGAAGGSDPQVVQAGQVVSALRGMTAR